VQRFLFESHAMSNGNQNSGKGHLNANDMVRQAAQGSGASLDEIRDFNEKGGVGVEVEGVLGASSHKDAVELEAFMNETVVINVAEDNDENAIPWVVPNVNGVNQPIFRGVDTPVKRKFIEVLARAINTTYRQTLKDSADPGSIIHVPKNALAYPFTIVEDRNPNGRSWLRRIFESNKNAI
jgi:hypothetical protein